MATVVDPEWALLFLGALVVVESKEARTQRRRLFRLAASADVIIGWRVLVGSGRALRQPVGQLLAGR